MLNFSISFPSLHRIPLCKFTSPNDDPLLIDGNMMFKIFGRGEMIEAEVMDYIFSYWKDHPEMKHVFESGERVLLGPFTIPVSIHTF